MGAVQGVEVAGTGFYVPAQVVTNEDYEERYGVSADWILQVSGIKARRLAAPSQACTDLAIPAAQRALAHARIAADERSEEHTSELQSQSNLVCRLLLEKKKKEQREIE